MANNRRGLIEALDNVILTLSPLGRVALAVLPALVLALLLEALVIRPTMQDISLLSIQEHTTRARLALVRKEVHEGEHLEHKAEVLKGRLEQTLGRLDGFEKENTLTSLDKIFQEGGIVLTQEPSIEPAKKGGYPAPQERLSASIETSYASFAWTLSRLPLKGPAYIPESFALEPSAKPKPGELYKEIPLKGNIVLIRVLSDQSLPAAVQGGAHEKGL